MEPYADLEIRIFARGDAGYPVEITLNHTQILGKGTLSVSLPGDGAALTQWFFADVALQTAWADACAQPPHRIRLRLPDEISELHALPWEALHDPTTGLDVAASVATPFSRFQDERRKLGAPVLHKPLRVLVAIAAPCDLDRYHLPPLNVTEEWNALQEATAGPDIALTLLKQPCTLGAIETALRQGHYHGLHMIAHGAYDASLGDHVLYLADDDNYALLTPGSTFASMLARHLTGDEARREEELRLVFLSSCESAARGLGIALIHNGVSAVVAMRDRISIKAAQEFGRVFYRQVLDHGIVDLASNQARAALLTHQLPDAAVPVLLMRLQDGQLFAQPAGEPPPTPIYTRVPEPRAPRLVGRDADLEWLCTRLKRGDISALAGMRGIGGIGKTELAIAAARALEAHFNGCVVWLDCGSNAVPAIQERVAAALGVKLEGDDLMQRADVLARAWRGQPPTLVVLDDVRAAHLQNFAALLPPRPPCALLVTSRRHDLPALPPDALRHLNVLDPAPSQALITDLLSVDLEHDPQAAGGIVELLDRIPLALTLVARRLATLAARRRTPDAESPWRVLLRELQERRAQVLHQGERPDLSVWVAFGVSYADLDPADQSRLRRLGVFARSEFPLAALRAVWDDDESAARAALIRLTDAGLLEEVDDDVWWMHDLLREYAAELLAHGDADEAQAARLAHAAYWQHWLDHFESRSVEDWQTLQAIRPEVDAAAGWLLVDWERNPNLAADLALSIASTYQSYTVPEWESWLMAGMAAARAVEQRNTVRRLQRGLAEHYRQYGDLQQAEAMLRESLATAHELLDTASTDEELDAGQRGVAVTQSSLADLLRIRGKYDEAEQLYRESLAVCEAVGDRREVAVTQSRLADLLSIRGKDDEAEQLYRESLAVFEAVGDRRSVAVTQSRLADLLRIRGKDDEAEQLYHSGLAICRAIRDPQGVAVFLMGLGRLALDQGRREEALPLLREARAGFAALGLSEWVAGVDHLLAQAGENVLTLDDLIAMVRAARQGDETAGQQAWTLCEGLAQSDDVTAGALGRALRDVLLGEDLSTACAALPSDLREALLAAL
ncbi:MAG TPA: tetratricopeptide repeat protein [Anaerolineae bacterium]|nr:tetratricopeptide repeat protein [Anaerolineae bacterium]